MIWYIFGGLIGLIFFKKRYNLSFLKAVWFGIVLALGLYFSFGAISTALIFILSLEEYSDSTLIMGFSINALIAVGCFITLRKVRNQKGESHDKNKFGQDTSRNINKDNYQPGDFVETNVAGVTFEGRQNILQNLKIGESIILKREPDNEHDFNAISVNTENDLSLGYIRRDLAKNLAPIIDKRYTGSVIFGVISSIYQVKNDPSIIGAKITFQLPEEN